MKKTIIVEGPSIEECLKTACKNLKCSKDEVDFEVLAEGKKGLFGFVSQPYKLRVIFEKKKEQVDDADQIDRVLEDVESMQVDINGYCDIKRDNEGIFLIIYPPQGMGSRVTLEEASKFVEESGIVNADFDAVSEAVNRADENPVRIADFDPSVYKDGEAQIVISKDNMVTELILIPPKGGNPVTLEHVVGLIQEKGVRVDVDTNAIKDAIENRIYNRSVVVAQGKQPENGQDARVEYKFIPRKDKVAPSVRDDGGVDFKKLDLIDNVVKGEILGEKIPCTMGEAGVNLLGESVPAQPGRDIILTPGKNVSVSEDGNKLIAEIDGQISFKKNVINVNAVYVTSGDVDYSVGDIDFVGNVVINGSVLDGFEIKCKGDLEVAKAIGSCNIEATGDIVVKGGILGKDKGNVIAGGSVFAKFIENCHVEAKEDIVVERAIMHSHVRAKKISVTSSKGGLIVGGEVQAEDDIDAITIGSNLATKTNIILGISKEVLQRLNEIEKSIDDVGKNLSKVNQAIVMFARIKERSGELSEENVNKLNKTNNIKKQLESTIKELEEDRQQLEEQLEMARGGRVRAMKVIHPGVTVTIGKGILQVKDEIKFASLMYEEGYVKIKAYD